MKHKILFFVFAGLLVAFNARAQDFWMEIPKPGDGLILTLGITDSGDVVAGFGDDFGVYLYDNNSQMWQQIGLENIIIYSLYIHNNGDIFAGTGGFNTIYRLHSLDEEWVPLYSSISNIVEFGGDIQGNIYAGGGYESGLLKSENNGGEWNSVLLLGDCEQTTSILTVNENMVFVGTTDFIGIAGGVYRSVDTANTWEQVGLQYDYISSLAINSNGVLFAGSRGNYFTCLGGVFKSEDMGNTWIKLTEDIWVTSLVIDTNDIIYAGTEVNSGQGGIFRSADNGQTWEYICSGMGAYPSVEGLCLSPDGYLYAYDTKLYRSAGPVYTSVNDNLEAPATGTISFYPNPATDRLTGRLTRKSNCDGRYRLSILSMSSQVVKEEETSVVSGMFTIPVTSLPSGLYVVRLTNNTEIFQARFVKR